MFLEEPLSNTLICEGVAREQSLRPADRAKVRGREIDSGRSRSANRQNARLSTARRALRKRGAEALEALLVLREHPDPLVRLAAAHDCIAFSRARAVRF